MIQYRTLSSDEICQDLFQNFIRRQAVNRCWRKEGGKWVIREDPFVDDWGAEEYQFLVRCLKNTVQTGGYVGGAFRDGALKGFVSVEAEPLGSRGNYRDLTSIHVSEDLRGHGIGKILFQKAKEWAAAQGAEKLYISSHSAVETQAFYRAMGFGEAKEYNRAHTEAEPYDCQLECDL